MQLDFLSTIMPYGSRRGRRRHWGLYFDLASPYNGNLPLIAPYPQLRRFPYKFLTYRNKHCTKWQYHFQH
jgi:hypothetical protein